MDDMQAAPTSQWKRYGAGGALVAGGLLAGGLLAGTIDANASTGSPSTTTPSSGYSQPATPPSDNSDQSQPQRSDEQLLTGTTLEKVTAAAQAAYPDATIVRVETDSDGVYEAHMITADGEQIIVQVGADFTVTGTQAGGPGGPGSHGGAGGGAPPEEGDASGGSAESGSSESGTTGSAGTSFQTA